MGARSLQRKPLASSPETYKQEGFTIARQVFSESEILELRDAFDDLSRQAINFEEDSFIGFTYFNLHRDCDPFAKDLDQHAPVKGTIRRVTYPYGISEVLNRYRCHPKLLAEVQSLLGDDLVQLVNQANFNPPARGEGWGWHQDYRFRRQGLRNPPWSFVQSLTAVDRCSEANGGIRLIPKSHELGPQCFDIHPDQAESMINPKEILTPELEPGDVLFFNSYIVHGSTKNRSAHSRRVYINGYAARTNVEHGIEVMSKGEVMPNSRGIMEFEEDTEKLPLASKY